VARRRPSSKNGPSWTGPERTGLTADVPAAVTGLVVAGAARAACSSSFEASEESGSPDLATQPGEPQGPHRHAPARHLPRFGRAQLRPLVVDGRRLRGNLVRHGEGRRTDRGHPQRAGRRRGPVLVPHPAPHVVADRGRGERPHPPAGIAGGGDPRPRTGPTSPALAGRVPRQRRTRRRRASPAHARPCRSPRGPHLGAALEVTGADGLPSPRTGANVLRPSTTLKFSLRLPPDVRCAGGDRCPDLGHPDRRRGAREP